MKEDNTQYFNDEWNIEKKYSLFAFDPCIPL